MYFSCSATCIVDSQKQCEHHQPSICVDRFSKLNVVNDTSHQFAIAGIVELWLARIWDG